MFLVPKKINQLDYVLNCFEVAFRSVISEIILTKYPDNLSFDKKLKELSSIYNQKTADGVLPAQFIKYMSKIKKYSNTNAIDEVYQVLNYCKQALVNMDYRDDKVFYVSELIDLILLFYKPLFEFLGSSFGRIEDYEDHLRNYLTLRNAASHPASSKITIYDTQEVVRFIILSLDQIDDKYFWYVSKLEIQNSCAKLLSSLDTQEPIKHNLTVASKKHKNLIERETEIARLKELIIGEGKIRRTAGSVVLHGSGGVGKTALALEFCYDLVLSSLDEPTMAYCDFILWLSSKEEELTFDQVIGNLHISRLTPQFNTLEELIKSISDMFEIEVETVDRCIEFLETKTGIIVLDNYETIETTEKNRINDFIKMCPRQIQFIITSRIIEEIAEASIPLVGFDGDNGKKFIRKYCEDNFYTSDFDEKLMEEFIKESCGNPLIMVVTLGRIIEGLVEMSEIVGYLRNYGTTEVEVLADFMYKNMLEEIISSLSKEKNCEVGNILNIMLLYDEPIDLYSLRDLTEIDSKVLEDILAILGNKLIISKQKGFFKLNELAIKFVLIKTLPGSIGIKTLVAKIQEYKRKIDMDLAQLSRDKAMFPILQSIIDDWKPISHPEQIAMAQAYNAHARLKRKLKSNPSIDYVNRLIGDVEKEFNLIKQRSNQPYIKFQHARILKQLLKYQFLLARHGLLDQLIASIKHAYSEAYTEIWTRYRHILKTKSFPAFLMQYGNFLLDNGESEEGFKLLERCVNLYEANFKEEILNRLNSHYYIAQAAIVCARRSEEYCKEYLSCCRTSIMNTFKLSSGFKQGDALYYQIKEVERKEKILAIINIRIIIMFEPHYRKSQVRIEYEKNKEVKMPFSLRWLNKGKRQILHTLTT